MNQPETTNAKINQWNSARAAAPRGLGDLSVDDLLSDSESTAAPEPAPITNEQLPIANYQSGERSAA